MLCYLLNTSQNILSKSCFFFTN